MALPIEEWYYDIPIVTRTYLTMVFLLTMACQLDLVSPLKLFYSYELVFRKRQYWRLLTTFMYFGRFSLGFIIHLFFMTRHIRMLEEGSFRGRTLDFVWLMFIGCISMLTLQTCIPLMNQMSFLSQALTNMMVYIWTRRNPHVQMNMMGVITFRAPYLSWVLLGFSVLLYGHLPMSDIMGMIIGHIYYFFDDVYPTLEGSQGVRYLRAPSLLTSFFHNVARDSQDPSMPATIGPADPTEASTSSNLDNNNNRTITNDQQSLSLPSEDESSWEVIANEEGLADTSSSLDERSSLLRRRKLNNDSSIQESEENKESGVATSSTTTSNSKTRDNKQD